MNIKKVSKFENENGRRLMLVRNIECTCLLSAGRAVWPPIPIDSPDTRRYDEKEWKILISLWYNLIIKIRKVLNGYGTLIEIKLGSGWKGGD